MNRDFNRDWFDRDEERGWTGDPPRNFDGRYRQDSDRDDDMRRFGPNRGGRTNPYGQGQQGQYGQGQYGQGQGQYGQGHHGQYGQNMSYNQGQPWGQPQSWNAQNWNAQNTHGSSHQGQGYGRDPQNTDDTSRRYMADGDKNRFGNLDRSRGPRGYKRSDERIRDDIHDRLMRNSGVDASEVDVKVQNGEVTLTGTCQHRDDKRRIEDIVDDVLGVTEIHNQIRRVSGDTTGMHGQQGTGQQSGTGQSNMGQQGQQGQQRKREHAET